MERHGGHRHKHRRHRKKRSYRLLKWSLALCLAVAAGLGFVVFQTLQRQSLQNVTAGNRVDVGSGYRNLTYEGKNYQYNSLVTAVLYAGIDSEGELQEARTYGDKARADSISLIVLDKKNEKMSILALNRNTMTTIQRYTTKGRALDTYTAQLAYAYSYGNGGEASCENLRDAVSELLGGIPIQEYVVTNRSSMTWINDLIGGVTVTVPDDELASAHPEMTKGAVVTLDDSNVEDFLRYRDTSTDFSNTGRMLRQQAYITAYVPQLKEKLLDDPNGVWSEIQEMDAYIQTSITKNKYLSLANLLDQVSFSDEDYFQLEGENQIGDTYEEFYYDEEALQRKVIELFYEEI
jgi:LCP family protein required for cell wall assembly